MTNTPPTVNAKPFRFANVLFIAIGAIIFFFLGGISLFLSEKYSITNLVPDSTPKKTTTTKNNKPSSYDYLEHVDYRNSYIEVNYLETWEPIETEEGFKLVAPNGSIFGMAYGDEEEYEFCENKDVETINTLMDDQYVRMRKVSEENDALKYNWVICEFKYDFVDEANDIHKRNVYVRTGRFFYYYAKSDNDLKSLNVILSRMKLLPQPEDVENIEEAEDLEE
jgi:hypothetical protein